MVQKPTGEMRCTKAKQGKKNVRTHKIPNGKIVKQKEMAKRVANIRIGIKSDVPQTNTSECSSTLFSCGCVYVDSKQYIKCRFKNQKQ